MVTDRAPAFPAVSANLCPGAIHHRTRYAYNPVECDHGRLQARLRPMRGLKTAATASMVVEGHAFIQNIRRGFHDANADVVTWLRVKHVVRSLTLAA